MDLRTYDILRQANNAFYQAQAASFSGTRHNSWPGWQAVVQACADLGQDKVQLLDVACGNLRFEAYLEQKMPGQAFGFFAVDNCDQLALDQAWKDVRNPVTFQSLDVLDALWESKEGESLFAAPPCDVVTCFGFMHHVPGRAAQCAVMEQLVQAARPGGYVAVSLWRFLDEPSLATRAAEAFEPALAQLSVDADDLEPGDAFLGWNGRPGVFRYCHSFSDQDIDALCQGVSAQAEVVARYCSDGRSGALNQYLILRRTC